MTFQVGYEVNTNGISAKMPPNGISGGVNTHCISAKMPPNGI